MATRKDSRGYSLKKGESQRKDGRYVFRYTTLRGEHRSVYAKELSELRKKEVKIRRAIEDGLDPDRAERITLNELFDEYISQKYDLKQSTMTNYKYMYNHYVRDGFGKLRISKIKYSDIKKFYYSLILEKGFKPNSMEIVHTLLHPTFTMAVRDGLLRLNPTEGVMTEIKKSHCWEKTKRHALTVAEQRAFTNYIANSEEYRGWFPLFTVMLGTGCRIGEVLGLRWQDVDFKNRTISMHKQHPQTAYACPDRNDDRCSFLCSDQRFYCHVGRRGVYPSRFGGGAACNGPVHSFCAQRKC